LLSFATRELIHDEVLERATFRDMGERHLKDLILPEHIFQLVIEDLPSEFPPLKTLDAYRHNLPAQITRFIGRENEISRVSNLLRNQRLVTLTGSGGIGKTRLSLQLAANMLDSFPGGVWFVELASLSDPELVPSTILTTLEVSDQRGKHPLEALKEYLQQKKILIVLDNCEHLIDSAARTVHAILSAAPHLKILATSREPLDVKGELTWQVPSLTLPDPKQIPGFDQLAQYEATRLFIDRASLVDIDFTVSEGDAAALAQICLRLDGIPLAIELAAARIRMLSLEQIASGLDNCFQLLTGGSRTDLPRQQTLRALIDWSYNLLSASERLLFRRLGVFAGGWSLELASQVCSDEKIPSLVWWKNHW
jgi:predicted ATPase